MKLIKIWEKIPQTVHVSSRILWFHLKKRVAIVGLVNTTTRDILLNSPHYRIYNLLDVNKATLKEWTH